MCSHTYNLLNVDGVPSSYDSVSVAAENVLGVGAARTCTTQTVSELHTSCIAILDLNEASLHVLKCCNVHLLLTL